ncbi:MAG: Xaa-Pro peptidase family protein [Dethiobacteria bacterium]|nr:Xaa-Pro peptidase family protein [Dethiobacteria bacterium]
MNSVYSSRRERLLAHLTENGPGKALITNPLNLCYLTGKRIAPYERLYALVLDGANKSCSFLLPSLHYNLPLESSIKKISYNDEDDPTALLCEIIGSSDCLGVEFDAVPFALSNKLMNLNNALRFADIGTLLSKYRMFKTGEEIEALQKAVTYSDQVYAAIAAEVKPGISEKVILSKIFSLIAELDGTENDPYVIQVLNGPNTANPHGDAGDRLMQKGEPLSVYFGVCYAHYWSDCTRTFFAGKPSPQFETIYNVVLEAQETAISKIKPGMCIKEVDYAARQVIEKAGYGEYFIHRTGHGIGLNIHEEPKIHCRNDDPLLEGMAFTVEPGIYIQGLGGVRIEDDVLVTAEGVRVFSRYPKTFSDMIIT